MSILVLIDGDILRYRCAFAAERSNYLVELTNPNGHKEFTVFTAKREADAYGKRVTEGVKGAGFLVWSRKEIHPCEFALQAAKTSLEAILRACSEKAKGEILDRVYLSGETNFRKEIATTKPYKGNRENTPKPLYYKEVGEYLVKTWGAVTTTDGFEADDAIGIAAMESKEKGIEYVVVSNDKDLDQIPGLHYDWTKSEFYTVSPKEAKTRFFIQLLAGDATDNVPGIPGIGEVTATKILAECKTPEEMVDKCWEIYSKSFENIKGNRSEDYFLEQASLVYILKNEYRNWLDSKEGTYFNNKLNRRHLLT